MQIWQNLCLLPEHIVYSGPNLHSEAIVPWISLIVSTGHEEMINWINDEQQRNDKTVKTKLDICPIVVYSYLCHIVDVLVDCIENDEITDRGSNIDNQIDDTERVVIPFLKWYH